MSGSEIATSSSNLRILDFDLKLVAELAPATEFIHSIVFVSPYYSKRVGS